MKKLFIFIFILGFIGVIFLSCDKDNSNPNYNQQTALAQNYALIQGIYSDIFKLVSLASGDSTLLNNGTAIIAGVNVTYDSINQTFTFNFGLKKSTYGKSGSFVATMSDNGDFQETGTKTSIAFNNFYVDGNKVEGSNVINNLGTSTKKTGTSIIFADSVQNAVIIKGSDTVTFNAAYTVEWQINLLTDLMDDQFYFGGNISATTNTNKSFTAVVSPNNKILFTPACVHIVSGIIDMVMITQDTNNTPVTTNATVDFIQSDGCNNQIQVTINGTIASFPI